MTDLERLQEQAAGVCADAEIVGYYGDNLEAAAQCFREEIERKNDKIRRLEDVNRWLVEVSQAWVDLYRSHDKCSGSPCAVCRTRAAIAKAVEERKL
jgi:hypothetical protein